MSGKNVRVKRPDAAASGGLRVWIDQDLCTGDGLCVDYAPEVFTLLEDGIATCDQDAAERGVRHLLVIRHH